MAFKRAFPQYTDGKIGRHHVASPVSLLKDSAYILAIGVAINGEEENSAGFPQYRLFLGRPILFFAELILGIVSHELL